MNHDNELAPQIIEEFYASLDCPRSLTCWLLYKSGQHESLANLEFNPGDYNDFRAARDSLAATKFLSKAEFLETGLDTAQVALEKFFAAEEQCRETNRRILRGNYKDPRTSSILANATRKIEAVLGDFDAVEWLELCNWGPGATVAIKRRNATAPTKFLVESGITNDAYNFVAGWWDLVYPNWVPRFTITNAAKVVTVPKNAKTDRTIAIEPGLNLWFQKGVGSLLKKRLKGIGIDLKDQSHNGRLARIGSLSNTLATIDFSAASDTVSKELVRAMIPYRWLQVLEAFRSSVCSVAEKHIVLEKFSSMGNGFTFELESLIFWAIGKAVLDSFDPNQLSHKEKLISVFGDDVVLNSEAADVYTSVCADLGFTVNSAKSYSSTYYRESCGEHYFNGYNIKPIFQKERLNGKTALLKLTNNVRRLSHRRASIGCDRALYRCWQLLADALGSNTPRISEGYGDMGIIENIDHPSVERKRATNGLEGNFVRVWAVLAAQLELSHHGLHLYRLQTIGSLDVVNKTRHPHFTLRQLASTFSEDEPNLGSYGESSGKGNSISLPGRTKHAKVRVLIPRWYDLGPWV